MALVTLVAGQTARAAHLNSNFALCVLTDTARTISVTHSWTASQTFTGGWTAAAACTISSGGIAVTGNSTVTGTLTALTGITSSGTAAFAAVTASSTLAVTGVATFTAAPVFSSGTASQTMELNGSKALTTVAITGTGNYVKSASPTLTGTITLAAATASGLITANAGVTVASGQTLTVTGATVTGLTAASVGAGTFPSGAFAFQGAVSGVTTLSASGTITLSAAAAAAQEIHRSVNDGLVRISGGSGAGVGAHLILCGGTHATLASTAYWRGNTQIFENVAASEEYLRLASGLVTITPATTITGAATLSSTLAVTGGTTLSGALTYGGVALSNAVTGTGNMVLSASPTFTGTIAGASQTLSGTLGVTGVSTLTGNVVASVIRRDTSDGADNSKVQIAGGGAAATTRGAMIDVSGNEAAAAGMLDLFVGVVASAEVRIWSDSAATIRVGQSNTLGFFGGAPAARPTGVAVTAAGIHAALVTLGLITA